MGRRSAAEPRQDAVMGALAVAVVLVVVAAVVLALLPDGDRPPPAEAEGTTTATAPVAEAPRYGCGALLAAGEPTRVSAVVATADRDALTDDLGTDEGILSVRTGGCRGFPVVVVSVHEESTTIPATGPRGTPVVVQPGLPFRPLEG